MDVRRELLDENPGWLSVAIDLAAFFVSVGRYDDAASELSAGIQYWTTRTDERHVRQAHNSIGLGFVTWGELLSHQGVYLEAKQKYRSAVASFDAVLLADPTDAGAHSNKSMTLAKWADLLARLREHSAARRVSGGVGKLR